MLLSAHRDGSDIIEATCLSDCRIKARPPLLGVNLRAIRVARSTFSDESAAFGIPNYDFD
jgi:hypothetical protein